jgi:lysophospholipase L1-like esterase
MNKNTKTNKNTKIKTNKNTNKNTKTKTNIKKIKNKSFAFPFMMIGSSMVQQAFDPEKKGFAIELANQYSRCADIILRGQGGYTSRMILLGINEIIGNYIPEIVILFIGNIDALKDRSTQVPVEEYKMNMEKIIKKLKSIHSSVKILLITPTKSFIRDETYTEKYVKSLQEIEKKTSNCKLINLWKGKNEIKTEDLEKDRIHLGISGNKKLSDAIQYTIQKYFPKWIPSDQKWLFPDRTVFIGKTEEYVRKKIETSK